MGLPEGHPPVNAAQGGGKGAAKTPPAAMGQGGATAPSRSSVKFYLSVILGVLGLVLIVGVVVYALRRQRAGAVAHVRCAACGEPLEAAYRYCPSCGTTADSD